MSSEALSASGIRRITLEQSKRARVGHIGSALSIADILATLYGGVLKVETPDDPDRDRFILSKGHAAAALYAALHLRGWVSSTELSTFCADGSLLNVHPEHALTGVDFSTGSLGHGLSIAAGAALGARLARSTRRVFVLLSDAECNEGSVWEAAMFAAHHELANLVAIIDLNGQQALGATDSVIRVESMADRWIEFGWETVEADGHDVAEMTRVLSSFDYGAGAPHVVVARTIFGRGVSYMERQLKWHYLPMSESEYRQALDEVTTR